MARRHKIWKTDLTIQGEGGVVGGVQVLRGIQVEEVTEVVVHVDSWKAKIIP